MQGTTSRNVSGFSHTLALRGPLFPHLSGTSSLHLPQGQQRKKGKNPHTQAPVSRPASRHQPGNNSEVGTHSLQVSLLWLLNQGTTVQGHTQGPAEGPGQAQASGVTPDLGPSCTPSTGQAKPGASPLGGAPAHHGGPCRDPLACDRHRTVRTQAAGWASAWDWSLGQTPVGTAL